VRNYGSQDISVFVIGNKKDLNMQREVTIEEGQDFAKKQDAYFLETSALDNSDGSIDKAFEIMTREILKRAPQSEIGDSQIQISSQYGGGYTTESYYTGKRTKVPNQDKNPEGGCNC